jgi:tetratricopeptide (TPR) repeat protein
VLRKAPVRDKMLAELALGWVGLAGAEARMAAALRVFVVTWDPLEHQAPRPVAAATVNAGPPGLEIVVYVPVWWVMESVAGRQVPVAEVVGELAGSAVVVAAHNEEAVTEGRYLRLRRQGSVPDLLGEPAAGAALGIPELSLVSEGWEPIGLGAIADVVQDALGPVDLDRSPVELAAAADPVEDCPACAGRRFGFPGELGEATSAMCQPHRAEAEAVSNKRYGRAHASNPDGWGAILDACRRLELPHLPNGLATRLARAEEALFRVREPEELTAEALAVVAAARWFPGRPEDLAVALGAEEDMAWLPEWLSNLVFDLGYAGLGAEAAEVSDALARVDPENEQTYASDVAFALAKAGDEAGTRARLDASLGRWPQDLWVRIHAGDALSVLGDADGAEAHFLAALDIAKEDDDFEARSDICERLERLGRAAGPTTTVRPVGAAPRGGRARRTRPGRNDPCFCGSGRKYKHCHGARS